MDLYQILELKPNASEIEIKKAYHMMAKIYHPDKCKLPDANERFQRIQSAYEILINNKTRQEYIKMNQTEQFSFVDILDKMIKDTIDIGDLKKYGINLDKIDQNFFSLLKSFNVNDLLNFFKKGDIPKKKNFNPILCSESDLDIYDETCCEYYYNLPILVQKKNVLDIHLDQNIMLGDVINKNKRKIKIKRKVGDILDTTTFLFDLSHPYIVYYGAGDSSGIDTGNLIIRLLLPNNITWLEDLILIEKSISLYELIYGLDININMGGDNNINIDKWVPSRDGFLIDISQKTNNSMINLAVKLYLNYIDSSDKEIILKKYFS